MKLNVGKFGLAGGIVWGVSLFVMVFISMWTGWAQQFLNLVADVYPGFSITPAGAVIGLIWGFFDCFIGFSIFAWLYNKLS